MAATPNPSRAPRVVRHPGDLAACQRLAAALRADGYRVLVAVDDAAVEDALKSASEADLVVARAEVARPERRPLLDTLMSWSFAPPSADDGLVPV